MMISRFVACFLAITLLPLLARGQAGWRFANPLPHGNNINDMALRSDNVVWQVGDRGQVHTSRDLETWTTADTGLRNSLRGITFFNGRACISGEKGLILSGPTAEALTPHTLNTEDWLEGIAASTNEIVAVGDNGAIYRSTDGVNWSRQGNFTTWFRGVAYGGGQFVAVGEDGVTISSTDGITWQQRPAAKQHLNRAAYLHDRFWIVGDAGTVLTSSFRMFFEEVRSGVTNDLYAVAGTADEVVIGGDLIVLTGRPGVLGWTLTVQSDSETDTLAPQWPYYSALWDGRLFLLGGRTGMMVEGFRTNPASPLQWFAQPQPTRNWLWSVTRQSGVFAAAGTGGTIVTSVDGFEWNREVTPAAATNEILLGINGSDAGLIAVGTGGIILESPNITTNYVSTNAAGGLETNEVSLAGVIWEQKVSPTPLDLQGVAVSDSMTVLTGAGGTILVRGGNGPWEARSSGTAVYLSGAAATPNGFFVCGDGGTILFSADGNNWIARHSGTTAWIYNVRHANGRLVAVGEGGLLLTSDNGEQWTPRTSGITDWINDVTQAGGTWQAVSSGGWILSSADAVTWNAQKAITSRSLYGVAANEEQVVTAGIEGVILRQQLSRPLTPVNFLSLGLADQRSVFLFGGAPGQRFVLESKAAIGSPWAAETTLEIMDPNGTLLHERSNTAEMMRIFRTRLAP